MPAEQENHTSPAAQSLAPWQREFLDQHQLPSSYLASAQHWFAPLVQTLVAHQDSAKRPVLVAVNGSQGSGKTTVCDFICASLRARHGLRALSLSLDDFYLTATERKQLASSVHPLLATRGVPGTHDMDLLQATLNALLKAGGTAQVVSVPRFDKAVDDRQPEADWEMVDGPVDVILLEGWCLGATAQTAAALHEPVNALEADEDADGRWRSYVNTVLAQQYPALYQRVDLWVMLQAPSFDCVYRWRLEQEQKLARRVVASASAGLMDEHQVLRFIQYYQRLTQHCLTELPQRVDFLYRLDGQRQIIEASQRGAASS